MSASGIVNSTKPGACSMSAMTRARDRLYLSSALKDGVLRPGPGSLADVLPASLKPLFAAAATHADDTVTWTSTSGQRFTWRVCRPPAEAISGQEPPPDHEAAVPAPEDPPADLSPWFRGGQSIPHRSVTEWLEGPDISRDFAGKRQPRQRAGRHAGAPALPGLEPGGCEGGSACAGTVAGPGR